MRETPFVAKMFVQGITRKLFSSVDHFVNFVNLKTEAQEKLVQSANCAQTSASTLEWRTSVNIAGAKAGAPRSNGLRVSTLEFKACARHGDSRSLPSQCSACRHCTNKKVR